MSIPPDFTEAHSTATALWRLEQRAHHPDLEIRQIVALNPSTPLDVLTRLAFDEDKSVRVCVALYPNTSITLQDPHPDVRGR